MDDQYVLLSDADPMDWRSLSQFAPDVDRTPRFDERNRIVGNLEASDYKPLDRFLDVPMEFGRFLRIGICIAAALTKVHRNKLVHRDIKPANILVNFDGDRVKITGFALATRLLRERQSPVPPESVAGTLAYMAPEQTGRMNRSIDSRSDLYALGVTFYQMLTGSLPFTAVDPMEWVHCHVAREAPPPSERKADVPPVVSSIVMKLLAKLPEQRYQTAAGVEADLRRCLEQWNFGGRIDEFSLAERDTPDQLTIPEKLYGRSREIKKLVDAFQRVAEGCAPELVLVSGHPGIGKSSLANELHRLLVPSRALFALGKFDQYKRDIPYSTLAQAFSALVRPLLGKSETELGEWRDALLEALGANAGLVIDLVPEVAHIIGSSSPVPELPPKEAQQRFQLVFRRFIEIFAQPEHPLVLLLDDLQWLDAATLDLVEDLLTRARPKNLMIIGAYRDNEVDSTHPLKRKLDAIKAHGGNVSEIALAPLTRVHLKKLMAEALCCSDERIRPLAQLVHDKTNGNPLFATQFITSLTDEGMLDFDHDAGCWTWSLDRIRMKGYTDNVVDLVVGRLNRLPIETQQALQLLACMGSSVEFAMLKTVSPHPEDDLRAGLLEAVRAGLVTCNEHSCAFVHDRVQEAAYSLIPTAARAKIHLQIGRLLLGSVSSERLPEMIFEIVNQLNRGVQLILTKDEREKLAELNLIAGKRAKSSCAYVSALAYLTTGSELIGEDAWVRRQELAFALELHTADCEIWTGALPSVEKRLSALAKRASDTMQRAAAASRLVDLYMMLGDGANAVTVGLDYLRHEGFDWVAHPSGEDARREFELVWSQIENRRDEELIGLPIMKDPKSRATLEVLTALGPPALYTDGNLYTITICKAVALGLAKGNCDASPALYVSLGVIAGNRFGYHNEGYQLGKMACELTERRGLKRLGGRTYSVFALLVPWTRPFRESLEPTRRAFQMSNEQGDPLFAALACRVLCSNLLASGEPLDRVAHEAVCGMEFASSMGVEFVVDTIATMLSLVRMLGGNTDQFGSLDDGAFTESLFEARLTGHPAVAQLECFYWVRKLQARFFAGDYTSAIGAAEKAKGWFSASASLSIMLAERAEYHLYTALTSAALCQTKDSSMYVKHREELGEHAKQLEAWEKHCPINFADRALLVGAEIARLDGHLSDAMDLYEQAVRSARSNALIQDEALSYELAARCYAARGLEEIAHLYRGNARRAYLRWGAMGKVRQLDQLHPLLRQDNRATVATGMIDASLEYLDLATVIKVSQAVSSEIVPEKLIELLLRTAIEHAGADRGLLIVPRQNGFLIQAEGKSGGSAITVNLREAYVSAEVLPESVIRYVARTQESVVLNDTSVEKLDATDAYIKTEGVRTVLCLPLMKQGVLIALLYLENKLAPGVFTPGRISVLRVIASQAAISLENSKLYSEVRQREAQIRRLIDANIVGIFYWDLDGQIFEANEAFLRMLGYDRENLVEGRLRWTDLTPPEWLERQREPHRVYFKQNGNLPPYEKEYFHRDGSRIPVLLGVAGIDEERERGVAFVVDMTERKRAEAELLRSRQYLAEAQKVSHTGSWAWCPVSNDILYFSDECYRILGRDPEKGPPSFGEFLKGVHPDDRTYVLESLRKAANEASDWEAEFRLLQFGTEMKTVRCVAHPVPERVGQMIEYIGTVIDVTKQKRAEQERKEYLWFLECMDRVHRAMRRTNDVEDMTRGVLAEARNIFHCDRAWLLYPCDPNAQTCRSVMENSAPGYPGAFTLNEELVVNAHAAHVLKSMLDAPGAVVDPGISPEVCARYNILSTIAIAIRPRCDKPYLFGLHQCSQVRSWTITELRLFEEIGRRLEEALTSTIAHRNLLTSEDALRHTREKLAHASRIATVAELSASIAHEINQPLQAVAANGQACRRWLDAMPPNLEQARLSAAAIVRDVYAAADVISRTRELFKRTAPTKVDVDLNKLILQVCALMANEIDSNMILLETQLTQDLPTIRADAVQIQQVMVNLVRNAIEALSATITPSRILLIRSRSEMDGVVVDVHDEGTGVTDLEKMFEPFTTTKETGMGMGLTICRSIIEAHAGRIWVSRNIDRGVTFSFSLPMALNDVSNV